MNLNYKKPDLKNEYYDDFVKTLPSLSGKTMAINTLSTVFIDPHSGADVTIQLQLK